MEKIQEQGIKFSKQGLAPLAKFTRIYTDKIAVLEMEESALLSVFDTLYDKQELKEILQKLSIVYDSMIIRKDC